jgi:SAM-dependent methyltransferase
MQTDKDRAAEHEGDRRVTDEDVRRGQAIYTPLTLRAYDALVLGAVSPLVWRCSRRRLLEQYRQYLTDSHLEVGVGTGYLLDHSRFPGKKPRITLLDLNQHALEFSRQRLRRYAPRVRTENVLAPIEFDETYRSVALHYVLHCLPGTMKSKSVVFAHLKKGLAPGGVLFGATVLGRGVAHAPGARALLALYNQRGIFNNLNDDVEDLAHGLQYHFESYKIELVGSVAVFSAHR